MRFKRLYWKIFLSFIGVLVLTEVLILGLFAHTSGRWLAETFRRTTVAQMEMVAGLLEESLAEKGSLGAPDGRTLPGVLRRFGQETGALIWITDPGQQTVFKSFDHPPPKTPQARDLLPDLESGQKRGSFPVPPGWKYHRDRHQFYLTAGLRFGDGRTGRLHFLLDTLPGHGARSAFPLGLLVIGLIVALLVIPVSRLITRPVNRLRDSALTIADGRLDHRAEIRTRDEIGQLGLAINHMTDRLARLIDGSRELMVNVSHQLRTPLTRLRVSAELLGREMERGGGPEIERHLASVMEEVEEMDRLVGRILHFSRLETAEWVPKSEPVDLAGLIRDHLIRLGPAFDHKGITVEKELPDRMTVRSDRRELDWVLDNLLANALKFTAGGGRVWVRLEVAGAGVSLRVTNSHPPLEEGDLESVFRPFYRVPARRGDEVQPGSGLGLAIARRIVVRLGGTIAARNAADGFEVALELPGD